MATVLAVALGACLLGLVGVLALGAVDPARGRAGGRSPRLPRIPLQRRPRQIPLRLALVAVRG